MRLTKIRADTSDCEREFIRHCERGLLRIVKVVAKRKCSKLVFLLTKVKEAET